MYTQLPDQPEPSRIWSIVEWSEVTAEYAGLFFRAEGGNSSTFGSTQQDNSPRLTNVQTSILNTANWSGNIVANGVVSPAISSGASGGWTHWGVSFAVSSGEVRPRNTAVRMWKRTK